MSRILSFTDDDIPPPFIINVDGVITGQQFEELWIDPLRRLVYVYAKDKPVELLDDPEAVSGAPLLEGFSLVMSGIWQ